MKISPGNQHATTLAYSLFDAHAQNLLEIRIKLQDTFAADFEEIKTKSIANLVTCTNNA